MLANAIRCLHGHGDDLTHTEKLFYVSNLVVLWKPPGHTVAAMIA